jgi:hypothetical protein
MTGRTSPGESNRRHREGLSEHSSEDTEKERQQGEPGDAHQRQQGCGLGHGARNRMVEF